MFLPQLMVLLTKVVGCVCVYVAVCGCLFEKKEKAVGYKPQQGHQAQSQLLGRKSHMFCWVWRFSRTFLAGHQDSKEPGPKEMLAPSAPQCCTHARGPKSRWWAAVVFGATQKSDSFTWSGAGWVGGKTWELVFIVGLRCISHQKKSD